MLVALTSALLVAFFAHFRTEQAFTQLLTEQHREVFIEEIEAYYRQYGTWEGVESNLHPPLPPPLPPPTTRSPSERPPPPPPPTGRVPPGRPPPPPPPRNGSNGRPRRPPRNDVDVPFVLIDQTGHVVIPARDYPLGKIISEKELAKGLAVTISDLQVATVLTVGQVESRDDTEEAYLKRTNRVLLQATLVGSALALLLGIVLARRLSQPLRELTLTARELPKGKLGKHVIIRSKDELGELADAFNQMSTELAKANELRKQMTADIAHELRTPLTIITGHLEGLRDGVLKPSAERFVLLHEEAKQLEQLIEDLRTLSLADAGQLPLHLQEIEVNQLLESVLAAYQQQASQRDITLVLDFEEGLPNLHLDKKCMLQVLSNLVSNALRYTPKGGTITLGSRLAGDKVELYVADSGAGIAQEKLPHIFERFFRADTSRQKYQGESGLGLAIVKALVNMHGGVVSAKSIVEKGTTITATFPISYVD